MAKATGTGGKLASWLGTKGGGKKAGGAKRGGASKGGGGDGK